jgi:hypothetical protein
MIPSRDQTGTPEGLEGFFHFTSSTIDRSAFVIDVRSCDNVMPRQSSNPAMIKSISAATRASVPAGTFFVRSDIAPSMLLAV